MEVNQSYPLNQGGVSEDLPPHDDTTEAAALGCIMLDSKLCFEQKSRLTESCFFDLRYRLIFRASQSIHKEGAIVDTTLLQARLKDLGRLEEVGGIPFIAALPDQATTAHQFPDYVAELQRLCIRRAVIDAAARIQMLARDRSTSAEQIRDAFDCASDGIRAKLFEEEFPAIVDSFDLAANPREEPKQLVHGLIHEGSKFVLGGNSKSFKTWCLMDLGISVSHGEPWLSLKTTQGRVLYLNFELPEWSFQRRLKQIADGKNIIIRAGQMDCWNLRGKAASFDMLLPKIRERIKQAGYSLIILDPIYKIYGCTDENSAGDVARLMNQVEDLAVKTGAAVAFGAHFSKGNQAAKESIDRISGSGVFARDPDSILVMTQHETKDAFTIDATLRNLKPLEPFCVRWQFPLMRRDEKLDP